MNALAKIQAQARLDTSGALAGLIRAQERDDVQRVDAERIGDRRVYPWSLGEADTSPDLLAKYDNASRAEAPPSSIAGFADSLSREEQDVFYLVFGEGTSTRDAGRRLRVSHMKVHRAAQRIVERARFLLERTVLGDALGR